MATAAQVLANRLNAQKSTGPRTPEGKAKVAANAVKHGLLARAAVLQGEDWEEFTEFRENLLEELGPDGTLEVLLAERIVSLAWRLQRAARLQNEAYESMYLSEATSGYSRTRRAEMAQGRPAGTEIEADDLIGGRMLAEDFGGAKVLDRMLLYERRIEHSLYRTLAELQKQRRKRQAEPPTAGATAARGTGILPVSGFPNAIGRVRGPSTMGVGSQTREDVLGVPVPPMNTQDIHLPPESVPAAAGEARGTHGRDGRATEAPDAMRGVGKIIHGRDAHATRPPDGGTTNAPPAEPTHHSNIPSFQNSSRTPETASVQDRLCETNPICPASNTGQVPCGTGVRNESPQDEMCEAKPMCDGTSLEKEGAVSMFSAR